ncbi:hypothetical protein SAMN05216489_09498 [Streptomyces sp. 3213]|uniref:hypothetical protein n=1 Tax=Streptomyces sp. 3213.3 TaxID=1855348 RepID=UPI00089504E7|nr:hypothetical protein [Streptomyces sp. 3213.3]SEE99951.1 hypothetical protein SAMN05216489_09498 [Streptomyces sp. 3213] [Streptomyces sp. 3213.3]
MSGQLRSSGSSRIARSRLLRRLGAGEHVLGAPFLAVGEDWRIGTSYTDANSHNRT